jgi:predicted esterase
MTREDRLREIEDYVGYLDTLADAIFSRVDRAAVRLIVLGFSQGVATVARWVLAGRTRPDHLILWASPLPPEIDAGADVDALARVPRISVVVGTGDAEAQRALPHERARMQRLGLAYGLETFEGGHRLDTGALLRLAQS